LLSADAASEAFTKHCVLVLQTADKENLLTKGYREKNPLENKQEIFG